MGTHFAFVFFPFGTKVMVCGLCSFVRQDRLPVKLWRHIVYLGFLTFHAQRIQWQFWLFRLFSTFHSGSVACKALVPTSFKLAFNRTAIEYLGHETLKMKGPSTRCVRLCQGSAVMVCRMYFDEAVQMKS